MNFNEIPDALRYPGAYVEIDPSAAGLGGDLPALLIVGQKLAAGTAAAGEVVRVSGFEDAKTKAGQGSMLASMVKRYKAIDQVFDVFMLPYADNGAGVAATGTITVTAVATAAGTLPLYIGGVLVSVACTTAQTPTTLAAAIAAAINANADLLVTATSAVGVVTLTAKHKGTCGNQVDLRLSVYGEPKPAGLALTLSAMAGGTGDPATGDLEALIGQKWFRYVVLGINDVATLAAWHADSQRRYKPPIQNGFRIFTAFRGDYLTAAAFGETKNYEHIVDLALGINPDTPWEAAAVLAAAAGPKLYNSPAASLEGTPLPGLIGLSYFKFGDANSLLFKGMSVMQVSTDGTCTIKRLVSMYQRRADGSADDALLDINTAELMERIRYEQRIAAIKRFTGSSAAKSNEGYAPGLRITTEDDVRALLLSLYQNKLQREFGWVQNYDYYKANLVVSQNATNPSRFDFFDTPVLLSPYYILAGRSQFLKSV